jgi:integrase
MSVYKRGDTWTAHMSWTDNSGKRQQKTKGGFRTKREAEIYHRDFLAKVDAGARIASPKTTLEAYLLERWLPQHSRRLRDSTKESYRLVLTAYVIPQLGRMRLDEIRTIHLETAYNTLWESGRKANGRSLSPKTIVNIASIVKRALRDAVRWELIAANPADSVQLPQRQQNEIQALSPDELRRYLTSIEGHRLQAALQLTCLTGMRRGEVLGLRWTDIDFTAGTVTIRRSRHRVGNREAVQKPKTEKANRTIHVDRDTLSKLKVWRTRQAVERLAAGPTWQDTEGYLVTNEDGSLPSISSFYRSFKKTIKDSGVPEVHFHALRHSYITAALTNKHDLKAVSERVGHADTSVTIKTYHHVLRGQDEKLAEAAAQQILRTAQ